MYLHAYYGAVHLFNKYLSFYFILGSGSHHKHSHEPKKQFLPSRSFYSSFQNFSKKVTQIFSFFSFLPWYWEAGFILQMRRQ